MISSTSASVQRPALPSSGAVITVASILAAGALALAGVVFFALAIAFPIVVSLADSGRISLSAGDLAASRTLADAAWLPATVGALHLAAALGVIFSRRWSQRLAFVLAGVGVATAIVGIVAVWAAGGRGTLDGIAILAVAAAVYLLALAVAAARIRARA